MSDFELRMSNCDFLQEPSNSKAAILNYLAERVGFEPTVRFPVHSISSAANSTTLAPLRKLTIDY